MLLRMMAVAFAAAAALGAGEAQAQAVTPAPFACPTDWRAAGVEDSSTRGTNETGGSWFSGRAGACAAGAAVDHVAYEAGFAEGLRGFCAPANGFRLGREGIGYQGACPADAMEPFVQAFRQGDRFGQATALLAQALQARDDLQAQRRDLDREIRSTDRDSGTAQSSGMGWSTSRMGVQQREQQLSQLRAQRSEVDAGLRTLQTTIPELEQTLATLRAEIGDRYGPL